MTLIAPTNLTARWIKPGLCAPTNLSVVYDPDMMYTVSDTFALRYIRINGFVVKSVFMGTTEISLIEFDKV
jgi:hypothetical protein